MPDKICDRIRARINQAREDPSHYFKRLTGWEEYSLRIGQYRIIAAIEGHTIIILAIGHRKNVYDT